MTTMKDLPFRSRRLAGYALTVLLVAMICTMLAGCDAPVNVPSAENLAGNATPSQPQEQVVVPAIEPAARPAAEPTAVPTMDAGLEFVSSATARLAKYSAAYDALKARFSEANGKDEPWTDPSWVTETRALITTLQTEAFYIQTGNDFCVTRQYTVELNQVKHLKYNTVVLARLFLLLTAPEKAGSLTGMPVDVTSEEVYSTFRPVLVTTGEQISTVQKMLAEIKAPEKLLKPSQIPPQGDTPVFVNLTDDEINSVTQNSELILEYSSTLDDLKAKLDEGQSGYAVYAEIEWYQDVFMWMRHTAHGDVLSGIDLSILGDVSEMDLKNPGYQKLRMDASYSKILGQEIAEGFRDIADASASDSPELTRLAVEYTSQKIAEYKQLLDRYEKEIYG